ncbi:Peptidyl-prolyl cis-trans isomerase [Olavius algarvensis spirochete endosymbiont]|uniref:peptidylprolyl isomerase n=1 Tax=Olavius algarvensis spirochete endosymbiont TaxID=260710 RepID=UPI0006895525|nr:peptidylprolyl isomerase [Olavius algarvensis spirochete endosymbiont]CAD7838295.1 MAG: hypothetical protein [Olavius algarvensis spirochete endosymbiont]VDB00051.1 Peptidyl-prolyl cis-trans isomerase [Olavius algarvensis spirochete endosymbiont]
MRKHFVAILLIISTVLWASGSTEKLPPGLYAQINTNRGKMIFMLTLDETPLTVANFCGLAEGTISNKLFDPGIPYFDDLSFYREAPNYAVFSGDPLENGTGGPGYSIPRETQTQISASEPGILTMDGYITESAGSRFFITQQGDRFLDTKYTAFGKLVSGKGTLMRTRKGDRIESIRILRIEIPAITFDDVKFAELYEAARLAEIENLKETNPNLARAVIDLGDEREKTPTGIYFAVKEKGSGEKPVAGSRVSVHYTGILLDGTVFDSTSTRDQTFDFTLGQDGVIPGWFEMITDMNPGEIRQVLIPPYLAYGDKGYGPIEPDSWLLFEMKLVSFF